jgi:hypothetical protein
MLLFLSPKITKKLNKLSQEVMNREEEEQKKERMKKEVGRWREKQKNKTKTVVSSIERKCQT